MVRQKLRDWQLSDRDCLNLYRSYPQTRYRSSLRYHLLYSYTSDEVQRLQSFPYREIETTLGFKPLHELEEGDALLTKAVTSVHAKGRLMIQQVLDLMSAETGVPLSSSPEFLQVRAHLGGRSTLSQCLAALEEQTGAIWVQRGGGYHLTRDE